MFFSLYCIVKHAAKLSIFLVASNGKDSETAKMALEAAKTAFELTMTIFEESVNWFKCQFTLSSKILPLFFQPPLKLRSFFFAYNDSFVGAPA